MRPFSHKRALAIRFWLLGATLAFALTGVHSSAQLRLELAPEYFYWQEDVNGSKLLDESGARIGLELSYKPLRETGWLWAGRAKAYYGSVDYSGYLELANGEIEPLKSTTEYYGGLLEGRYGYRWALGQEHFLDLMAGPGVELWLRRLGGPGGYDELWLPLYLKAGADLSPRERGWIASLGLKLPFYTTQWVYITPSPTLHPQPMVSGYAEAGYRFGPHFSLTAFFDSYWFNKSPVQSGYYQPESKTFQAGAKIGWTF